MLAAVLAALSLTSPVFSANGTIPAPYTCDGSNLSPPLNWTAPPRGTRSFSLTMVDIDAGPYTHWSARGIPATTRRLRAGQHPQIELANSFGRRGYAGPCPPPGAGVHRYVFTLRALGARSKVLAVARLVGRYGR